MVSGRAVAEAVAMSRDHPELAVGLHWDVWGEEDEQRFDINNLPAVRDEFHRQLDAFYCLLRRMPTHIDSHRHAHLRGELLPVFRALVEPLSVPLRYDGLVRCVASFYAQWEWMVTNLEHVSVPFLQRLLHEEVSEGWTEFSCHPGYVSSDFASVYLSERETEVRTLTDPRIRHTIEQLGICLVSYADYPTTGPSVNDQRS
jgi:predicted glycoside hydrolase/deacetylase ChbG (UPF0249 family)